ncbi:MAG: hypothetical protein HFH08_03270 [Bacilli bacterium]|nr:hypothetical protein [Bacilli bacterium]
MEQALKNQYYDLIENKDYDTLSLINSIFSEFDTLLLMNRGKNQTEKFLNLISVLEFTEETLYNQMKQDIQNGVF